MSVLVAFVQLSPAITMPASGGLCHSLGYIPLLFPRNTIFSAGNRYFTFTVESRYSYLYYISLLTEIVPTSIPSLEKLNEIKSRGTKLVQMSQICSVLLIILFSHASARKSHKGYPIKQSSKRKRFGEFGLLP